MSDYSVWTSEADQSTVNSGIELVIKTHLAIMRTAFIKRTQLSRHMATCTV